MLANSDADRRSLLSSLQFSAVADLTRTRERLLSLPDRGLKTWQGAGDEGKGILIFLKNGEKIIEKFYFLSKRTKWKRLTNLNP